MFSIRTHRFIHLKVIHELIQIHQRHDNTYGIIIDFIFDFESVCPSTYYHNNTAV